MYFVDFYGNCKVVQEFAEFRKRSDTLKDMFNSKRFNWSVY